MGLLPLGDRGFGQGSEGIAFIPRRTHSGGIYGKARGVEVALEAAHILAFYPPEEIAGKGAGGATALFGFQEGELIHELGNLLLKGVDGRVVRGGDERRSGENTEDEVGYEFSLHSPIIRAAAIIAKTILLYQECSRWGFSFGGFGATLK